MFKISVSFQHSISLFHRGPRFSMQCSNTKKKAMYFNTYIKAFIFKSLPLSDSWFEYSYLKTIMLWMCKTTSFTRWRNIVKHLVFLGLALSAYNSFLKEKEKMMIFQLLPDVKWQWL